MRAVNKRSHAQRKSSPPAMLPRLEPAASPVTTNPHRHASCTATRRDRLSLCDYFPLGAETSARALVVPLEHAIGSRDRETGLIDKLRDAVHFGEHNLIYSITHAVIVG